MWLLSPHGGGQQRAKRIDHKLQRDLGDQISYNRSMEPTIQKHIESREGVCGGKPCIAGTRIRVWDIYVHHEIRGMSPGPARTLGNLG